MWGMGGSQAGDKALSMPGPVSAGMCFLLYILSGHRIRSSGKQNPGVELAREWEEVHPWSSGHHCSPSRNSKSQGPEG